MSELSETHQMMIVNAACHAIAMNQETERIAIAERNDAFHLMKPQLFQDGNQWCALYGENLQVGIAGFGDSPHLAALAFNEAWYAKLPKLPKLQPNNL